MKKTNRIVIVDSNPASTADFRAALEMESDLTLAAAVTCASCSFAAVSGQRPDLVVLSLSMPGYRILELVKDLLVLHADLKILIVSSHEQELETARVLRAGAHGCVMADCSIATKIDAVRQVLAGNRCFTPQTARHQNADVSLGHCVKAAFAL